MVHLHQGEHQLTIASVLNDLPLVKLRLPPHLLNERLVSHPAHHLRASRPVSFGHTTPQRTYKHALG